MTSQENKRVSNGIWVLNIHTSSQVLKILQHWEEVYSSHENKHKLRKTFLVQPSSDLRLINIIRIYAYANEMVTVLIFFLPPQQQPQEEEVMRFANQMASILLYTSGFILMEALLRRIAFHLKRNFSSFFFLFYILHVWPHLNILFSPTLPSSFLSQVAFRTELKKREREKTFSKTDGPQWG